MPNSIPSTSSSGNPPISTSESMTITSSPLVQHTHSCNNIAAVTASSNAAAITFNYKMPKDELHHVIGLLMGSFTKVETVSPEEENIIELIKIMWQTNTFSDDAWESLLPALSELDFVVGDLFPSNIDDWKSPYYAQNVAALSSAIINLSKQVSENKDDSNMLRLDRLLESFSCLNKNGSPWFSKRVLNKSVPGSLIFLPNDYNENFQQQPYSISEMPPPLGDECLKKARETFSLMTEFNASVDWIDCSYKVDAKLKFIFALIVKEYFAQYNPDISACFHFQEATKQQADMPTVKETLIYYAIREESGTPVNVNPLPPFATCLDTTIQLLTHLEEIQPKICGLVDSGIDLSIENLTLSSFRYSESSSKIHLTLHGILTLLVAAKSPYIDISPIQQDKITTRRNHALYDIINKLLQHTLEWQNNPVLQELTNYKAFKAGLNKPIRYYREELEKIQSSTQAKY